MTKKDKQDIMTAIIISGLLANDSMSANGVVERALTILKAIEEYEDRDSNS